MEIKELPNLSRYLINSDGEVMVKELTVYSARSKSGVRVLKSKWLKGQIDKGGYKVYHLKQDDGKTRVWKAHRLVCTAWYENENNKPTVNHIDGDKLNNHYSNLEWATWSENNKHSFTMKLNGEHCYSFEAKERRRVGGINSSKKRRKLSFKTAEVIRDRISKGAKQKDLAIEYGVSRCTICEINKGIRYYEE